MGKITISLPDDMVSYLESKVGEDFPDAAAVIVELVRRDKERRIAELRHRLEESLASGVSTRSLAERIAEGDRLLKVGNRIDG